MGSESSRNNCIMIDFMCSYPDDLISWIYFWQKNEFYNFIIGWNELWNRDNDEISSVLLALKVISDDIAPPGMGMQQMRNRRHPFDWSKFISFKTRKMKFFSALPILAAANDQFFGDKVNFFPYSQYIIYGSIIYE